MFCSNRDVRKLTVNSPLLTCQHIPHLLCVDRTGPANNIQWDIRRLFQCWNPKSCLNANSIFSFRFFFHVFPLNIVYVQNDSTIVLSKESKRKGNYWDCALFWRTKKYNQTLAQVKDWAGLCVWIDGIFFGMNIHTQSGFFRCVFS